MARVQQTSLALNLDSDSLGVTGANHSCHMSFSISNPCTEGVLKPRGAKVGLLSTLTLPMSLATETSLSGCREQRHLQLPTLHGEGWERLAQGMVCGP